MENKKSWILGVGLVLIIASAGFYVISIVQNIADSATSTFDNLYGRESLIGEKVGDLSTQVSQALNPTPTVIPDPITILHEIRSLARLETIHYSLEKIITAEVGQGAFAWLIGDRLIFVAHGEVIAGIDLAKIDPNDLRTEDNVLYVTLPLPEIFITSIDNDKSYIYDRETGLFTKGNVNLETAARQSAEEEILRSALENGILNQASLNAENYLLRLLRNLGFSEVIFTETSSSSP
jgi:hypothetical protein